MKHLLLITALFVTVACSKESGNAKEAGIPLVKTPEISIPEVELDLEPEKPVVEAPEEQTPIETPESPVVIEEPQTPPVPETPVVIEEPTPTPAPTPDTLTCELTSENERQSVTLKLNGSTATLAFPEADQIVVEGFRFKADGVKHEDPFFEYEGKRVLNVKGRVEFDTETKQGQLQVSLRLRDRGAPVVTDFLRLADIASCR
ncbi:MAG: hypothetical protein ACLGG7_13310 [Bacteriovoracia bacterium]